VEDGLASNGPHIQLLEELNRRFILGVKPGDHQALFAEVERGEGLGHVARWEVSDEQGVIHRFRFVNAVPLNQSCPDGVFFYAVIVDGNVATPRLYFKTVHETFELTRLLVDTSSISSFTVLL
jgi:hypothetical protein